LCLKNRYFCIKVLRMKDYYKIRGGTPRRDGTILKLVFYRVLLFSLLLFLYSCASKRKSDVSSSAPDYAAEITGMYYGSGKLWEPGDVKDVEITLNRNNNHTVTATIIATLPAALQVMGGRKILTSVLTVSPDYELTGTVKLMIFNFNVTGSVNPANHTIKLNMFGKAMGHPLNFELTGELGQSESPAPNFATDVAGFYYGAGTMTGGMSGDVTDAEIILAYADNTTVTALIEAVLPAALQQAGGLQIMRGNLTVSPDYKLTGTVRLMRAIDLAVTGSVDPGKHTIELNLSGSFEDNPFGFQLTGGPDEP